VPAAEVRRLEQLFADSQANADGLVQTVEQRIGSVALLGNVFKVDGCAEPARRAGARRARRRVARFRVVGVIGSGSRPEEKVGAQRPSAPMTALQMQTHLRDLQTERALASVEGLSGNSAYMADLDQEIAATHSAYVGVAVTEIATLRAQLFGSQWG
jgi:hypothetical protein